MWNSRISSELSPTCKPWIVSTQLTIPLFFSKTPWKTAGNRMLRFRSSLAIEDRDRSIQYSSARSLPEGMLIESFSPAQCSLPFDERRVLRLNSCVECFLSIAFGEINMLFQ